MLRSARAGEDGIERIEPGKKPKSRCWAFTINSVQGAEPYKPDKLEIGKENLTYYKYQLEQGLLGTKHYQGCLGYNRIRSMEQVKGNLGTEQVHLGIVRNWKAVRLYCGKADTRLEGPWEDGVPNEQGKRNDLGTIAELVVAGKPIREIAVNYGSEFIKFHRGILALRGELDTPRRREKLRVYVLLGDTGVGKSFFINKYFPSHYSLACLKGPWCDGYRGEEVIAFEEFGPGLMGFDILKRLLDVYPTKCAFKGGFAAWNPEIIFITSNYEIGHWYPGLCGRNSAALERRLTVIRFEGPESGGDWLARNEANMLEQVRRHSPHVRRTEEEASGTVAIAERELVPKDGTGSVLSVGRRPHGSEGTITGSHIGRIGRLERTATWIGQLDRVTEVESDGESIARSV